jgi:hypothetical protein
MTKSFCRVCNCIVVSLIVCLLPILDGCVSSKVRPEGQIEGGPFKNYDTACRDSIMRRWQTLLDKDSRRQTGAIKLQFHLNYDGTITGIRVLEDSVGDGQVAICENAVLSSAPFPCWPTDMQRMVGANFRVITFTFNYY